MQDVLRMSKIERPEITASKKTSPKHLSRFECNDLVNLKNENAAVPLTS